MVGVEAMDCMAAIRREKGLVLYVGNLGDRCFPNLHNRIIIKFLVDDNSVYVILESKNKKSWPRSWGRHGSDT